MTKSTSGVTPLSHVADVISRRYGMKVNGKRVYPEIREIEMSTQSAEFLADGVRALENESKSEASVFFGTQVSWNLGISFTSIHSGLCDQETGEVAESYHVSKHGTSMLMSMLIQIPATAMIEHGLARARLKERFGHALTFDSYFGLSNGVYNPSGEMLFVCESSVW
ncbi:MAG: hypothetical protein JKX80_00990, partial [Candidatus Pacebacteria bacterium]|nr:hypothetical protein [Candidatus Paceibacterota bacterium]